MILPLFFTLTSGLNLRGYYRYVKREIEVIAVFGVLLGEGFYYTQFCPRAKEKLGALTFF